MNILKKIFGVINKSNPSPQKQAKEENDIQDFSDTTNFQLKTHIDTVTKEFSFLIDQLGFSLNKNRFYSREFWQVYSKDHIDVEIMFENGSLPWVRTRNKNLPYDESKNLDNTDWVQDYNEKIRQLIFIHSEIREPIFKRFLNNDYNMEELNEDYRTFGQKEHIEYLKEAGKTIRDIIENKKGKINM